MFAEGTRENPWKLRTPPLTAEYEAWLGELDGTETLVVGAGNLIIHYDRRCLDDTYAMLTERGDWVELGTADEQKEPMPQTLEAWARSPENPVGGWYGLTDGLRGRFAAYVPPLLERLGKVELEHNPRNNRVRAL